MLPLMPLLVNKWVIGSVAGTALVGGVYWYGHSTGKDSGKQEAGQESAIALEKMRASDQAATQKILNSYQTKLDAADVRLQEERATTARFANLAASISQQRVAAASQTRSVADADILPSIKSELGGDPRLPLTFPEQRSILACLKDQPLCQKENDALKGQIGSIRDEVKTLTGKVDDLNGKYVALEGYTGRLHGYYVTAWNLVPKKRNKLLTIITFGIKGKAPKLSIPSPSEVK